MKRGGQIALNVLSLGLFGFVKKIVENRKAVRAGKPRPHSPGELIVEALEMGAGAALPAVRNDKVREGIERGMEMLEQVDPEATPRERPHRGVR